ALEFLPNSPTLMNADTGLQQLAACFVLPVEDSIEGIFDAVKWAATVHQSGGGTGFSFSRLRPSGDKVGSTMGQSSGPVSFMKVFDVATDAVRQGGRRRGASMGVLRVDHPDIFDFIQMKGDLTTLSNFNISVAITDEFMQTVDEGGRFALINPRNGQQMASASAEEIFHEICTSAWKTGDPGVIFIDEINRHNPTPAIGAIESTNPCGEVPLLPFEACNLGSINLLQMVTRESDAHDIDWQKLDDTADMAVRFLDNVIDAGRYPLPQIEVMARGNRKIGLGVMGFADLLLRMGIRYGSDESVALAHRIMERIRARAELSSTHIAESRGSFPNIEGSRIQGPRRNATLLSIAPTGTISMIAGCSSGIEPNYAFSYQRHVLDGEVLSETNQIFMEKLKEMSIDVGWVLEHLRERRTIQDVDGLPASFKHVFVTAHEVRFEDQVRMQAAFQDHVDNAVSKTINLPHESTVDYVKEAFRLAHRLRCKGITVYREGSKPGQTLTAGQQSTGCAVCGKLGLLSDGN
ncbi:MAG TPA: adenosylcobalamin-dependent ribonucleoside-diphosphate reductase, partial [Methanomassiliicoccales archaeon]|nr:adenosylcobalamin-dependent ribonucleoside-diphosphate reductase [Methanomassiliicoccales archaeon]